MNCKIRIEIDIETAELLNARAAARGIIVSDLIADLAGSDGAWPAEQEAMRRSGDGPWSADVLAEDARRLTEFHLTREGVPWDDVKIWMQSWTKSNELPTPKSRKL